MRIKALTLLMTTLMLNGCVGAVPRPETQISLAPSGAGNGPSATIQPMQGVAQHFNEGSQPDAQWWVDFGSPKLNALVERALLVNNDLATAEATYRQAREQSRVAGAAALPSIDASYQPQRARISNALSPPLSTNATDFQLHTAQVTVGYTLDVFGATRAKISSARAAAEVQHYRFIAARTTVVTNLVQATIQRASLVAQIDAANTTIAANTQVLRMIRLRQRIGTVGAADIAAQETTLAMAEATLPPLIRAEAHQRALISQLLGQAPGQALPGMPTMDELQLPVRLPLELPSQLVAHRPDVRAAKATMEGAAADVRASIAARLPALTLSANYGGASTDFASMFASGNPFWSIIGGITQPIFHGGALKHGQRAMEAVLDGAKSQYRAAVLQAFVDVSDTLYALKADADLLDAAARAQDAARRSLTYVTRQLQLGDVGTLTLLNAQAANAAVTSTYIQAKAARLSDTVALIQALGGGWDEHKVSYNSGSKN